MKKQTPIQTDLFKEEVDDSLPFVFVVGDLFDIYFPEHGVRQEKILIDHDEYLSVKNITDDEEYREAYKKLGGGKEWFTNKSPYYDAIHTGIFSCNRVSVPCIITIKTKK